MKLTGHSLYGGLHGLGLVIQKQFTLHVTHMSRKTKNVRKPTKVGYVISVIVTYIFTSICWVFFRAGSFKVAIDVLRRGFGFTGSGIHHIFAYSIIAIVLLLIYEIKNIHNGVNEEYIIFDLKTIKGQVLFFTFLFFIFGYCYIGDSQFIYAQF